MKSSLSIFNKTPQSRHLHGVVGAGMGAILSPNDPLKGAAAGAIGGMVAETLAEATFETLTSDKEQAADFGRFGGATAALLLNQNPAIAIQTADNAVENNFLMPAVPYAVAGGIAAWTAYDIYDTYQTQGPEAALQKAGIEAATALVGGAVIKTGFKVAGRLYPTAELAWSAYAATSPKMMSVMETTSGAVSKIKGAISKTFGKSTTESSGAAVKTFEKQTDTVWDLGPVIRGEKVEQALGQNLHKNFPIIDKFNFEKGVATSIKSLSIAHTVGRGS